MTKKEAIDLLAYFTLISTTKQGEQLIDKYFPVEKVEKMMKVVVSMFDSDPKKAEEFILCNLERLLDLLDKQEISESQIKYFKGDKSE